MTWSLNKVRRGGAIFFEMVALFLIAFYCSPELLITYQSSKSVQSFFQADAGNPIVYHKASENFSYTDSITKIQITGHHNWDVLTDLPLLTVSAIKALFAVTHLRNVFYVFININAP